MFPLIMLYAGRGAGILLPFTGIFALLVIVFRVIPLFAIKNARHVKISEAKAGIVRLEGTAIASTRIKSPVGGVEPIYYRSTAWHRFKPGENGVFHERLLREEDCLRFVLSDGSGEIVIEGAMPKLVTNKRTLKFEFDNGKPPPPTISPDVSRLLRGNHFLNGLAADKGYFTLTENYIPSGTQVIIIAKVAGGKAKPIILTDQEFYRVETELMYELVVYSFCAFFALATSFGIALAASGMGNLS